MTGGITLDWSGCHFELGIACTVNLTVWWGTRKRDVAVLLQESYTSRSCAALHQILRVQTACNWRSALN